MKKILLIIFFSTIFYFNTNAQETWVPIYDANGQGLYVDIDGLQIYKGDDFYVWTLETHDPTLVIESVNGKIAKTKTYYHINKVKRRYSIAEIIYYDKKNNVLASFDYRSAPKVEANEFNYPIIDSGQMDLVLKMCGKYLGKR